MMLLDIRIDEAKQKARSFAKQVFKLYREGKSAAEIAAILNAPLTEVADLLED